jgi:hypothetical protein
MSIHGLIGQGFRVYGLIRNPNPHLYLEVIEELPKEDVRLQHPLFDNQIVATTGGQ